MKLFWILLADFLPTKHELPIFSVEGRFMHDPSIPRLQSVKWNWPFMCRNLCCGLLVAQCSWRCQTGSRIRRTSKPHNQNGKIDQTCSINHFCLGFPWVFLHIKPSSITFLQNLSLSPVVGNHLGHEVFCFVCLDVEHLDHGAWNSLAVLAIAPLGRLVSTVTTTVNKTTQSLEIKMSGSMLISKIRKWTGFTMKLNWI